MNEFLYERRLREDLRAMRHLPPGTHLPQPTNPTEQQLLSDLLGLPDEVDPLYWLQADRGLLVALITLKCELQRLKQTIVGLTRARREDLHILADLQALLGNLVRLPENAEPFLQLSQATEFSPEFLRSVLQQLRELRGEPASTDLSSATLSQRERLLVELLDLPEAIDPLYWIHNERSTMAASIALSHILKQCRPTRTLKVGSVLQHQHLREVLRAPKGVHVRIREFVVGTTGFMVSANIRLSTRLVTPPTVAKQISSLVWLGFDRVVDDQGFQYLLQSFELEVGSPGLWGWCRETLHLAFYPAVAAGTTALTFIANPVILEASRWIVADPPHSVPTFQSLPALELGDLTWEWSLSR